MMARNYALVLSTALAGGGAEAVARLMVEQLNGSTCVLFENDASVVVPDHEIRVISRWRTRGPLRILLVNIWRLLVVQVVKLQLRPAVTISHLEGPNFANMFTFFGGRKILFVHNRVERSYYQNRWFDKLKKKENLRFIICGNIICITFLIYYNAIKFTKNSDSYNYKEVLIYI